MGEEKAESNLTSNEKRVLLALDSEKERTWDQKSLAEKTGINEDSVRQTVFMLAQKGLCEIKEEKKIYYRLTWEGRYYKEKGLPEKRALDLLRERKSLSFGDLRKEFLSLTEANISTTWLLRKGYARIEEEEDGKILTPSGNTSWLPPEVPKDRYPNVDIHEEIVRIIPKEGEMEEGVFRRRLKEKVPEIKDITPIYQLVGDLLRKRKWLKEETRSEWKIAITEAGEEVVSRGISVEEELTQLTPELIKTGLWRGRKFKRYDVNLPSKEEFPAKTHPYQRILDRMRKIFTEMGFEEIKGDLIQSAFWNFDALFVPQDHPAREMQDTFFLGVRKPLDVREDMVRNIKAMHEHGGSINSTGWGGKWRRELSEELLLRTHTTAVTLRYLALHPEPPVKVFCIDRVYRRESIDPTHLPEFDQLEGIVMDRGVTFSNLLGLLAAFYKKMRLPSIRFRPGYFPYTEPSVEVEVYMPEHGWLELGGAGIFREEVTNPVGVRYPVLAWGLGIGRLAMLSLGLTDMRDLYQSDIDWLRKSRIFW